MKIKSNAILFILLIMSIHSTNALADSLTKAIPATAENHNGWVNQIITETDGITSVIRGPVDFHVEHPSIEELINDCHEMDASQSEIDDCMIPFLSEESLPEEIDHRKIC